MAIEKKIIIEDLSLEFSLNPTNYNSLRHRIINLLLNNKKNKIETYTALKDVNLNFETGDRVALRGHNGAGKTSLLRCLANVYEPTQGKIQISGSIVSFIDITMGMNPEATGKENIYLRGIIGGLRISEIKKIEENIINFANLGTFIDQPIKTYSSGMITRLGFSILTAFNAEIILMDEWLSTGDSEFQEKAQERIFEIIDKSHIFIMASHSIDLINKICNKIVTIDNGKVIKVEKI
jgi:lipopolysaccharide transport system ATP-binding protein